MTRRLTETEFGWLVGILEGEGTFVIRTHANPNRKHVSIRVCSTDEWVVDRLLQLLPVGNKCLTTRLTKTGKQVYNWTLSKKDIALNVMISVRNEMSPRRRNQIDNVLATVTP